jgi:Ca2+-binding EF-hand superfamily protein
MAAAGNKQGLVALQQAERILAPQAEVIALSVDKVHEDLAAGPSPLTERKLNQLLFKISGQQESVEYELNSIREAKERVTEALEERVQWAEERLDQLKASSQSIDADLEHKVAAWRLDLRVQAVCASNAGGSPKQQGDLKLGLSGRGSDQNWKLAKPRAYRAPLTTEVLEVLKEKVRAAAYTGVNGCELDVVFRRFDKDGSGQLDEAELRMALRRVLRVPPSIISDAQISSLVAKFDTAGDGLVSVPDLISFLGSEGNVSKRSGKSLHGALLEMGAADPGSVKDPSPRKGKWQLAAARPYRPPISAAALDNLRTQIKKASYTGVFGRQLDVVFGRFDKDGSGQLDDDEVRQALRRVLKITPAAMSDGQIIDLCAALDRDSSGAVSIQELVNFVGDDADVSARTGHKIQSVSARVSVLLEAEGLPQVSRARSLLNAAANLEQATSSGDEIEQSDSTLPPVSPGRNMTSAAKADSSMQPYPPSQDPWQASPNSVGRSGAASGNPVQQPQVLPNLAG